MDTNAPVDRAAAPRFQRYDCSGGCPVEAALEQIAGKWKGLIIYHLMDEPCGSTSYLDGSAMSRSAA